VPAGGVDQAGTGGVTGAVTCPQSHVQRVEDQAGPHPGVGLPAHDPAGEHVDHERHVDSARSGGHVGEVGHPQGIRAFSGEPAVDQVTGAHAVGGGNGGAFGLAACGAGDAQLAHQPLDRASGHADSLAAQYLPHLPRTADLVVVLPHVLDLDRQPRCLGERGFALLTGRWRVLRHFTTSPRKIGRIVKAALTLTHFEHGRLT
jgi:hypothetical protein